MNKYSFIVRRYRVDAVHVHVTAPTLAEARDEALIHAQEEDNDTFYPVEDDAWTATQDGPATKIRPALHAGFEAGLAHMNECARKAKGKS